MTETTLQRHWIEAGHLIDLEVPEPEVEHVLTAVRRVIRLQHGDFEAVSFASCPGTQRFRVLPGARNAATDDVVTVPCVSLRFFVPGDDDALGAVMSALYDVHPYEEPVIYIQAVRRGRHIAGADEDNPNRFWNRETPDWVPEPHRN